MKKLLLLSLTILLFSCGDNRTNIEEECLVCWELIEVVREVEEDYNVWGDDLITYTVTAENTCTGEQKTGVSGEFIYDDFTVYVGNVLCEGLFEDNYTFE